MPITCQRPLRPFSKDEFAAISFDVMRDVFSIHNELGRLFDEKIYKRALARRRQDVQLEVPVDVTHGSFAKRYFLDVLVGDGALLEFKAVEAFTLRHKSQLLHYLQLTELLHGLLINVRPEQVVKEFVNVALTQDERLRFTVKNDRWKAELPGCGTFRKTLEALLKDWGTCLDLSLYEEAVTHFLGGEEKSVRLVAVTLEGAILGKQLMRHATEGVAFKLTAFDQESSRDRFEEHTRRFIAHCDVEALLWANIGRHEVTFTTLRADRKIGAEK